MNPFLSLSLCSKPQLEGTNTTPTAMQLSEWRPQLSVTEGALTKRSLSSPPQQLSVNAKPGVVSESSQSLSYLIRYYPGSIQFAGAYVPNGLGILSRFRGPQTQEHTNIVCWIQITV